LWKDGTVALCRTVFTDRSLRIERIVELGNDQYDILVMEANQHAVCNKLGIVPEHVGWVDPLVSTHGEVGTPLHLIRKYCREVEREKYLDLEEWYGSRITTLGMRLGMAIAAAIRRKDTSWRKEIDAVMANA
jgi:hypothetical protein